MLTWLPSGERTQLMPEATALTTAPPDASSPLPTRSEVACVHCGLPCRETAVSCGDKNFCCSGCQTVYEILTENGLSHFYELNDRAGVTIRRKTRREQFLYLDEPAVREKLVDFSDGKTSRVTFRVPTIHCIACVWLLENLFRLHPGIGRTSVNFPKQEVAIQFKDNEVTLSEVVTLLTSLGYEPTLSFGSLDAPKPEKASRRLLLQLGLAGFAFGNVMLISICQYQGLDTFSSAQFKSLFGWVSLALAVPVLAYSASDYWRLAWTAVRQKMLNIELPIAAGLVALFARSVYEVLTRTGDGYFDSLCGLVFFLLIGRWFQQKTYERLSFDRDYKSFFPLSVRRLTGKREDTVPLSSLAVGDRLLLRRGELIPADAIIVNGEGVIDYRFVTGESDPVARQPGDLVYAGGQQTGGALEVEMVKPVSQSYLTSLWSHEAFAKPNPGALDSILNRFSRHFTLAVSGVALSTAAWWWFHGQGGMALKAFTSVLIVACPCALALSAPFALGTAMRLLGRRQVFLKNPQVVETLAKASHVVFDKTGTLTDPGSATVEFHGAPLSDAEERWLYSMTRHSTHPLPVRIGETIANRHFPETVHSFIETPGCGMEGRVAGQEIWMGAAEWLTQRNAAPATPSTTNGSSVHVAINGKYRGAYTLRSALRPEVQKLISHLSPRYRLTLLSGDNDRDRARFEGVFGGNGELKFNQQPHQKLEFISEAQQEGQTVIMVGDGLNDAAALKQSDAGVAVVENIGAFSPASDIIVEAGNVPRLGDVLAFAKRAVRVVWLCIGISVLYNFVGVGIATTGKLSPLVCAVLMPLSSITVVAFAAGATHWLARRHGLSSGPRPSTDTRPLEPREVPA